MTYVTSPLNFSDDPGNLRAFSVSYSLWAVYIVKGQATHKLLHNSKLVLIASDFKSVLSHLEKEPQSDEFIAVGKEWQVELGDDHEFKELLIDVAKIAETGYGVQWTGDAGRILAKHADSCSGCQIGFPEPGSGTPEGDYRGE